MAYRFTPADRGAFKRCRRPWDFGARERQNWEPAQPPTHPRPGGRGRRGRRRRPGALLEAGYRDRGPERVEPGRLGAATWGMGRGAAPPRFDAS
jgi:hypothetical protein